MASKNFAPLFALAICLLAIWAVWEASAWDLQARLMPWMIGIPTALFAGAVTVQEFIAMMRAANGDEAVSVADRELEKTTAKDAEEIPDREGERRRTAVIMGWIFGFALGIWLLGFHLGAPLATLLYLKVGWRESWSMTLTLTIGAWLSIAVLFDCTMHIFFTEGELFVWLGIKANALHAAFCQVLAI
jgi:Tripartite tricarboxylate transporter TctB family